MFSKVLSLSCVDGTLDSGWGQIILLLEVGGAEGCLHCSGHSTHRRRKCTQTTPGPGVTWKGEALVPGPKGTHCGRCVRVWGIPRGLGRRAK